MIYEAMWDAYFNGRIRRECEEARLNQLNAIFRAERSRRIYMDYLWFSKFRTQGHTHQEAHNRLRVRSDLAVGRK